MRMAGRHIGWDEYKRRTGGLSYRLLSARLLSARCLLPALSVSLLLLAGCATEAPSGPVIASAPQVSAGPASAAPSKESDSTTRDTALPSPGGTLQGGLPGGLAGLLPEPPRPDNMSLAPQGGASSPELVGMTANQLGGLLGQPRYLRRETPAQVWQYADRRCILDIFLYPEQGEYRVVHVETRDPRSLSALNVGACLNGLAVMPASLRGS